MSPTASGCNRSCRSQPQRWEPSRKATASSPSQGRLRRLCWTLRISITEGAAPSGAPAVNLPANEIVPFVCGRGTTSFVAVEELLDFLLIHRVEIIGHGKLA